MEEQHYPEVDKPGNNRLLAYDVAEWLRLLVKMRVIRKDSVSGISQGIRARLERGEIPWETSSDD